MNYYELHINQGVGRKYSVEHQLRVLWIKWYFFR